MLTFSVQSGSNGNCIYYESGGTKLLFDAGITFLTLKERLTINGVNPSDINGLFISHNHSDHSKSIGVFQRKMKIPVFISPKTFWSVENYIGDVDENNLFHFIPNDTIDIGKIKITTIRTPHDGIEPAIFIIDDGKIRVGIFTDLGYGFDNLINALWDLDIIYMESNYDLEMLKKNPSYPDHLKRRIVGTGGHIDNTESANLIKHYTDDRLKYLLLSHLSENNNTPALALETHNKIYEGKNTFELILAPRYSYSQILSI